MHTRAPQPDAIHTLRNLIAYFIERQRLVVLAMVELAPAFLTVDNPNRLPIDLAPYLDAFDARRAAMTDPDELHQGIWKHDWRYLIHGIGCKLTHIHTGEPVEWDAPDPLAFRFDWFWQHLAWRIDHEAGDPYVARCAPWWSPSRPQQVKAMLSEHGAIITQRDGTCVLS